MQSVMWRQIETINPNQIQLRSGEPVSKASCSISSMSSKSEILAARFIVLFKHRHREMVVKLASLRQTAGVGSFNESARRFANFVGHTRFGRHKLRRKPRKQSN